VHRGDEYLIKLCGIETRNERGEGIRTERKREVKKSELEMRNR